LITNYLQLFLDLVPQPLICGLAARSDPQIAEKFFAQVLEQARLHDLLSEEAIKTFSTWKFRGEGKRYVQELVVNFELTNPEPSLQR